MLNLKSGINREISGDFVLDEDAVRRIVSVLSTKAQELSFPTSIVFHVAREDYRFYETERLEDVLSDANIEKHRILKLSIEIRSRDPARKPEPWGRDWIVSVAFNLSDSQVQISIHHDDRGWALLLADEIEPQIDRTFTATKTPSVLLQLFYFAIAWFLFKLIGRLDDQWQLPRFVASFSYFALAMAWGTACIGSIHPRNAFIRLWAGPEGAFNWGDQTKSYARREDRRRNIFWTVLIGFVVAIGTNIYTEVTLAPEPSKPPQAPLPERRPSSHPPLDLIG